MNKKIEDETRIIDASLEEYVEENVPPGLVEKNVVQHSKGIKPIEIVRIKGSVKPEESTRSKKTEVTVEKYRPNATPAD